ncbi:glycosyl hydrolase family 8 [Roseomonas sp. HF4]|uniref:glycosyl hydrolase family 8 n=1 Tax=Roseomonas sp. HF4 TaxID=2562313 RepID=UPI00148567F0|nr:glycosyl hydrolase family 8 [Roseomonas sp. HF4]
MLFSHRDHPPGRSLRRRALLLAPALGAAAPARSDMAEWRAWHDRFVTPDGRVRDTGNNGIAHSEGQGWGLIFSAFFGDRPAFERILAWTSRRLRRPGDRLHAWRYRPGLAQPVDDPNNATDGDLYIVWGLLAAHRRWGDARHREGALAIARDLLRLTLRETARGPFLLPGAAGFETPEGLVLNPSYILLPVFAELSRAMPNGPWQALSAAGLDLLRRARFGAWGLSPDWVLQPHAPDAPLVLPARWPPRFSYDAVRVPLMLAWAGQATHPALLGAVAFWTDQRWPQPPAWVDLISGVPAEYGASVGARAIAAFASARIAGRGATVSLPSVNDSRDYYSASLLLLVRAACADSGTPVADG